MSWLKAVVSEKSHAIEEFVNCKIGKVKKSKVKASAFGKVGLSKLRIILLDRSFLREQYQGHKFKLSQNRKYKN